GERERRGEWRDPKSKQRFNVCVWSGRRFLARHPGHELAYVRPQGGRRLSAWDEDRGSRGLWLVLRSGNLRIDIRPQRDAESASAIKPERYDWTVIRQCVHSCARPSNSCSGDCWFERDLPASGRRQSEVPARGPDFADDVSIQCRDPTPIDG